MTRQTLTIQNPRGIHLRPATLIVEAAKAFPAHEVWMVSNTGERCEPTSPLGILALGLDCGTQVTLEVSGPKEKECAETLAELLTRVFDF